MEEGGAWAKAAEAAALMAGFVFSRSAINSGVNTERSNPSMPALGGAARAGLRGAEIEADTGGGSGCFLAL